MENNNNNDYLVMYVHSTGLNVENNEAVEIVILDSNENVLLNTLIKPTNYIEWRATKVHNITNEMVKDANKIIEIKDKIEKIIKDKKVYFFNKQFTLSMLNNSFKFLNIKTPEPLKYDNKNLVCVMEFFSNEFFKSWNEIFENYDYVSLLDTYNYFFKNDDDKLLIADKKRFFYDKKEQKIVLKEAKKRIYRALPDCRIVSKLVKKMVEIKQKNKGTF